jgi:ribonuclease HI
VSQHKDNDTSSQNRPPWTTIDHQQHDFDICTIVRGSNNQGFPAETNQVLKEKYERHTKIYTNGSKKKGKVGCAVVWKEQTIKRKMQPQNLKYSTEQLPIINAIYSTWKKEGPKVIITDSLSTVIAVSDKKRTENSKTQTIRKLMGQQGGRITLLWVPGHVSITNNDNAGTAAKEALNELIQSTEKYPPQDLTKWIEHDNRVEGAQTTHKKQQGHSNNDQKKSSGNQPTQNRRNDMNITKEVCN